MKNHEAQTEEGVILWIVNGGNPMRRDHVPGLGELHDGQRIVSIRFGWRDKTTRVYEVELQPRPSTHNGERKLDGILPFKA